MQFAKEWEPLLSRLLALPRFGFVLWRHGLFPLGFQTIQSIYKNGVQETHKESLQKALINVLKHSGAFYIKIGRILSTREDLLPEYVCEAFGDLYTVELPEVDFEKIEEMILEQYPDGSPFVEIHKKPLGVGSVAQVHEATLKNGDIVAVKFLKPNVKENLDADIEVFRLILKCVFEYLGERAGRWSHLVLELVNSLSVSFKSEVDLEAELLNLENLKQLVSSNRNIVIPKVYKELSGPSVLVMEKIPGIVLSRLLYEGSPDPDLSKKTAPTVIKEFLKQIIEFGVFHPDPHAGNFVLLPDGRLGFVDMAFSAVFDEQDKSALMRLVKSILLKDAEDIVSSFSRFSQTMNEDTKMIFLNSIEQEAQKDQSIGQFVKSLMYHANANQIFLNEQVVSLIRALITVEALSKSLDPELNLTKTVVPTIVISLVKSKIKS